MFLKKKMKNKLMKINSLTTLSRSLVKIQIRASKEVTNRVYVPRMKLALRLRIKLTEMHDLFRKGKKAK